MPVTRPRRKARRALRRRCVTATSSGASAIHANAGWPNLGKLSARSAPERSASRNSKDALAGADVPLHLLFLLELPCRLVGVHAIGVAANLHAIDYWRAGSGIEHEGRIALRRQPPDHRVRLAAILERDQLHDPRAWLSRRRRGIRLGRGGRGS